MIPTPGMRFQPLSVAGRLLSFIDAGGENAWQMIKRREAKARTPSLLK